mmetsp:Transcript_137649/g.427618  ORF Transcript_137649/g.427618 Transcript_137649/m.427618 type:complete len:309 (+) Transcript_137649:278-1204(+)
MSSCRTASSPPKTSVVRASSTARKASSAWGSSATVAADKEQRPPSAGTKRFTQLPHVVSSIPRVWKKDMRNLVRKAGSAVSDGSPMSNIHRRSSPRKRLWSPQSDSPHVHTRASAASPLTAVACRSTSRQEPRFLSRAVGPRGPEAKTSSTKAPGCSRAPSCLAGSLSPSSRMSLPERKRPPQSRSLLKRPAVGWKFFRTAKPTYASTSCGTSAGPKPGCASAEATTRRTSSMTSASSGSVSCRRWPITTVISLIRVCRQSPLSFPAASSNDPVAGLAPPMVFCASVNFQHLFFWMASKCLKKLCRYW